MKHPRPASGRLPFAIGVMLIVSALSSSVLASGWPPFARDDSLTVQRGGAASVLDNGRTSVLANDFDIERDPLTADLVGEPKHGQLTLNADGTFVYQHDGDKKKDDEFSYRAFDGTGYSRTTRVKIEVIKPVNTPPFTVGSPPDQEAVEGVPFILALADYFSDLDEDDTLVYSAGGLPGSRRLAINPFSGVLAGTPAAADARDAPYNITVIATDSGGLSAALNFRLTIYADNRADLAVAASLTVNPVTVGESAQWNIVVENRGPANLDEGELVAQWNTSGPTLSLSAPQDCTLSSNNSSNPTVRCSLNGLGVGTSRTINVQGTQDEDGDNTLIAVAVSDDPIISNNSALIGAQVVAVFSEGPSQILSETGSDIAIGDLNADGQPDLVVTSDQTVVFLNDGNRSVRTPGTSLGVGSGGAAVVVLDWNGDGSPDVAVAGIAGMAGRVYLNNGNGSFVDTIDLKYSNSGIVVAAAAADFAQDGFADIVLTGTSGSTLLRNTGQPGFLVTSLTAGPGIDVSVADINGDSFADILIVESVDRSVRLLRNSGNGRTFVSQRLQRGSVAAVTGADLNGNGRVDLMLAIDGDDLTSPRSRILYQRTDGTFPAGEMIGASPLSEMLAGDVDGDLLTDIVALNDAGVHQMYRGNSAGGFDLNEEQIVSAGMERGVLLDFNNDLSLDLIMAGRASQVVEIHANNGIGKLGLGDRIPPVVLLNGEATVILPAGATYEDPGATAADDIDGDLTGFVVTRGSFNPAVVGTYRLTYEAADRAGNLGIATRVIQVGVNEGVGGGGGGGLSSWFLMLLSVLLLVRQGQCLRTLPMQRTRRRAH